MQKIIACDFDGCLCENKYPEIGPPIRETITALRQEQSQGALVILWTCRRDKEQEAAVTWCKEHGLLFDAVNENLLCMIEAFIGDTRKVFADEYWDDKAVKRPVSKSVKYKNDYRGVIYDYYCRADTEEEQRECGRFEPINYDKDRGDYGTCSQEEIDFLRHANELGQRACRFKGGRGGCYHE
jgi:hydroxymethylpyrimidine pyrophosphatase-like HAD family hydrolase